MKTQAEISGQTNEEWLSEYIEREPFSQKTEPKTIPIISQSGSLSLEFDSFRTTKVGKQRCSSVVLSFVAKNNGAEYVVFFNVDTKRQRGAKKGQCYPSGVGGQFLPKKRSKFRKFWNATFEKGPRRWSTVHKELNTRMKGLVFTGCAEVAYDKDGRPFNRLTGLRLLRKQCLDNFGTTGEQKRNNNLEQSIS